MSQHTLAALAAGLAWIALIAYAVLGGADFGGGVWDLLARGSTATQQRAAIARGMGPVWEANNVWLVFVLVVTWTAFPIVFSGVSTALYIPITLVVVGIVLRGAAFSFRSNYGLEVGTGVRWGHVFSIASTITPFLFGAMAGALASGNIYVAGPPLQVRANPWTTWTTPFALACGLFAVALCSVLAATYLIIDVDSAGESELAERFRLRALIAGAITAALGALAAVLSISEAPKLWHGLTGKAAPFSLAAVLIGLATAAALIRRLYAPARVLVVGETACVFVAWGVAQWPYLIVPNVTVDSAASSASVLGSMLIVSVLGLGILLPSLWYLFSVVKRRRGSASTSDGTAMTTALFVASLPQPVTVDGSATFSAQTSAVEPPALSGVPRVVSVLAVVLAIVATPFLTAAYDGLRHSLQRQRSQRRHSVHT